MLPWALQSLMGMSCHVLQVCFEFLFDSVRPTAVLPCGHTIHSGCLKELQRNRTSTCPICMKSYGNMDKAGLCALASSRQRDGNSYSARSGLCSSVMHGWDVQHVQHEAMIQAVRLILDIAILQVWERLDEEVATTPMPREYCNWQVRLCCLANIGLCPGRPSHWWVACRPQMRMHGRCCAVMCGIATQPGTLLVRLPDTCGNSAHLWKVMA